jgi:hypothetical protein
MRKARKPYGDAMIQSHEPAIVDLALFSLHSAIRRIAAALLDGPGELDVPTIRRVERLMRIALDLAGAGKGMPVVEFHGIRLVVGPGALPETLSVPLTDLLAARASDDLPAALEGDPEALRAFEREAELLLETEDIQRLA